MFLYEIIQHFSIHTYLFPSFDAGKNVESERSKVSYVPTLGITETNLGAIETRSIFKTSERKSKPITWEANMSGKDIYKIMRETRWNKC
jgi:hypothetical protein